MTPLGGKKIVGYKWVF